jgi:hypothetical protein
MRLSELTVHRWSALWRSKNHEGLCEHLCFENCLPVLFGSEREARKWIKEKWGYIRKRPDLRVEPHGWKVPIPVRVKIEVASK